VIVLACWLVAECSLREEVNGEEIEGKRRGYQKGMGKKR